MGVQRALDAGVEAVHLEEPEFWVNSGYSEGFKREWQDYYDEPWQPPHSTVDAQWRASKLKYYLFRRALQQVFDHVQAYNRRTGREVRCYVPTHSLINYASWEIVSPESRLPYPQATRWRNHLKPMNLEGTHTYEPVIVSLPGDRRMSDLD